MSERPSDAMQPSSKRRPGGQLTKDDMDDEEDGPVRAEEGHFGGHATCCMGVNPGPQHPLEQRILCPGHLGSQGYDPGSWAQGNKASTDTIAKRKIIKVRRGGAAAPEGDAAEATGQEAPAAANPFAGIALPGADAAANAAAPPPPVAANPFAGVSLTAPAAASAEGAKVRPEMRLALLVHQMVVPGGALV